jgi:hypothetical protein
MSCGFDRRGCRDTACVSRRTRDLTCTAQVRRSTTSGRRPSARRVAHSLARRADETTNDETTRRRDDETRRRDNKTTNDAAARHAADRHAWLKGCRPKGRPPLIDRLAGEDAGCARTEEIASQRSGYLIFADLDEPVAAATATVGSLASRCASPQARANHHRARIDAGAEHRAPSTEHRAPSTEHRAPSTDHRPPPADHRPPTADHRRPTTEHRPPTAARRPPTADRRACCAGGRVRPTP